MGQIKRPRPYPASLSLESSYDIFMSFVQIVDGKVDCSKLLSSKCYKRWLRTRLREPRKPPESFRRAITAHCRGEDGRRPFPREVEESLLKLMRKKRIWSCFRKTQVRIGARGYQAIGYWEKKEREESCNIYKNTDGSSKQSDAQYHALNNTSGSFAEDSNSNKRRKITAANFCVSEATNNSICAEVPQKCMADIAQRSQTIDQLTSLNLKADVSKLDPEVHKRSIPIDAAEWLKGKATQYHDLTFMDAFTHYQHKAEEKEPVPGPACRNYSWIDDPLDSFCYETLLQGYQ
mmetsp:Transcript_6910/g.7896  ORF Transcript_6910/g.7896 Transcript_6910/m.7896 type:complete len:291 (-) Transcript_6910:715-1587(-)|eukprot:CAMPEP_0204847874 /NCGR_PEP_ID=MMETSP1347-20130617/3103_1 /ASSEMBLY_ACC=CAM_ASM_000690 /TAXON_ID=215587 /ORGANISM="Aplanochytrium stocchinoi, Strain GSBS06" /LENGTH=290 /DNA_ID=CAMNT_0051989059 /DNA_START=198 /DNA_END=1070 /DNA_ORIENTATION=+